MPQWLVKLAGNDIDLRALSGQFTEQDCRIENDTDGAYHLTSDTFDSMTDAAEVHTASNDMLLLINDLMQFRNSEYQPASVDKVIRINADGTRSGYVFGMAVSEGSSRATAEAIVVGPDGKVVPSPEPALSQARLKLAQQDPMVKEAVGYWRGCNPGDKYVCFNAHKVFEIIRKDMAGRPKPGGPQNIRDKGWATTVEIDNFQAWANSREISGEKARHADSRPLGPGITPLSEREGLAFIRRLLGNWLDWKVAQMASDAPARTS